MSGGIERRGQKGQKGQKGQRGQKERALPAPPAPPAASGVTGLVLATMISLPCSRPLPAQTFLEQFSYEGLRLSGIAAEFGVVGSNRLTDEPTGAVRVDYGFIAPNIRLLLGASYFKGDFAPEEIAEFEDRLRGVVDDPTGDFDIQVGTISLADLELAADLQYVLPFANRVVPYLGVGIGIHFREGGGEAIEGTFVEDALDTVAAAATFSAGTHVAVAGGLFLTGDLRVGVSSELRTISGRGGLMYRLPARGVR